MTRRERLERKLNQRTEWSEKAAGRADKRLGTAKRIADGIPLGQPILVGHHSEKHARKDAERIDNNMRKGFEEINLSQHHTRKAAGLERQLDRSIFSDDTDAVARLKEEIAKGEELQTRMKAANAAIRKAAKAGPEAQVAALVALGFAEAGARSLLVPDFAKRIGFPSYAITNNGANIRRLQKRVAEVTERQTNAAKAEAAPGGVRIVESGEYALVTFAEKPASEILAALREAEYRWGGGRWVGRLAELPAVVRAMVDSSSVPRDGGGLSGPSVPASRLSDGKASAPLPASRGSAPLSAALFQAPGHECSCPPGECPCSSPGVEGACVECAAAGRLPYEAPTVLSEDTFETLAMSCGKSNPHFCPSGSKHS